jgi:hypothetical protein
MSDLPHLPRNLIAALGQHLDSLIHRKPIDVTLQLVFDAASWNSKGRCCGFDRPLLRELKNSALKLFLWVG